MWHALGGEKVNTGILLATPERKRPLGEARCGWEDYIK